MDNKISVKNCIDFILYYKLIWGTISLIDDHE